MPLTLVQAELVSDERVGININYDNNTYGTVVKSFVATLFTIDADNRPFGFAAWEVNPQGGNSIFLEIDDRIFLDGSHRYAMVIDYVEVSTKAPVEKKHGVTSQQATSSQITGLVIDRNLIPNLINGEPIIARYVYIKNRSFCEVAGDNAIATCRGYGGIKSFYCNERTRFVRLKCVD
ncbi:MAG: hypothetical protein HY819_11345 [Acidobacteria bacterium]|nr:hypothetical protein [Acidobacteriota bacterium]